MPRGAAPTPHARHTLPPLSADLPRHPWGAGGSRPARQPVLPWGTRSPWGCHHLHREVQPGSVVCHPLCRERRLRSAPAGTRRCWGATGPRPRRPVTVKHLAQLLTDEPLDLIVIYHVSLGGHGRGHRHRAPWGNGVLHPSQHGRPSLPSSPGVPAARGCLQVLASQGDPSLPRAPVAPRGPWSRSSPAPLACRLCPSPRGSLSRRGIQLRPAETRKGRAQPWP